MRNLPASHALLSSRKYEVRNQACKLLSATLHQTNYYVNIAVGVSDSSYCSILTYPLYGTRQRSGYFGTIWLFPSTFMMQIIQKHVKIFLTQSPDSSQSLTKCIIYLVDDKEQYTNNWETNSEQKICENL